MMAKPLTLGSLFDGIGGFPLAGLYAGITPVWASEIEPFPIRVTTKRIPRMKHYGDIRQLHGDQLEPVDIISFGSPCQDLSIAAGVRAGLSGHRSGLFFEATRIIKEMRDATDNRYPRFVVWENVFGALSSNKGNDYSAILEAFCALGGYTGPIPEPSRGKWATAGQIMGDSFSIAWRVLDAQWWGVPQRRRRIFLVADLGGGRAGEILFEREGMPGHSEPSAAPGPGAAADAVGRAGGGGGVGCLTPWDGQARRVYGVDGVFPALAARGASGVNQQAVVYPVVANALIARHDSSPCIDRGANIVATFTGGQSAAARSIAYAEGVAPTLRSSAGGNSVPEVVYAIRSNSICRDDSSGCDGRGVDDGAMYTLDTKEAHGVVYALQGNMVDRNTNMNGTGVMLNRSPTINTVDRHAVVMAHGQANAEISGDVCPTMNCNHEQPIVVHADNRSRRYIVRRLTPLEACRLMGYPDGWTENLGTDAPTDDEIEEWRAIFVEWYRAQGKQAKPPGTARITKWLANPRTDTAEYKAYGNSLVIPCVFFVLDGIVQVMEMEEE